MWAMNGPTRKHALDMLLFSTFTSENTITCAHLTEAREPACRVHQHETEQAAFA